MLPKELKNKPYKPNDPVYLDDMVYKDPKEYFKSLFRLIKDRFKSKPCSIIDIGCASGAFLYFIEKQINIVSATGIDISNDHLAMAKKTMPKFNFINDSVLNLSKIELPKYDICTFLGTMSIFDNIEPVLKNLVQIIKKKGVIYIIDCINDEPIDMVMRYRRSTVKSSGWESGFNIRSKNTYKDTLKKLDGKLKLNFYPFEMKFPIKKSKDPMRAWTIVTRSNENQIVVGTGQMLNIKILEIFY